MVRQETKLGLWLSGALPLSFPVSENAHLTSGFGLRTKRTEQAFERAENEANVGNQAQSGKEERFNDRRCRLTDGTNEAALEGRAKKKSHRTDLPTSKKSAGPVGRPTNHYPKKDGRRDVVRP